MLKKRALELSLIALVSAAYGCEDASDDSETSGAEAEDSRTGRSEPDARKSSGGSATAGKAATATKAGAGGASAKPAAGSGGSKSAAASGAAATHDDAGPGDAATGFVLTSDAFKDGEKLPKKYRCEGAVGGPTGPNPPLHWSGAPASTKSFALVLRDRTFNDYEHWTIYDIPAQTSQLPEGVPVGAKTEPQGAKQADNSARLTGPGYYGPCGPSGMNNYEFVLFALDVEALPDAGTTGTSVESALADHVLATSSLKVVSGPE